MAVSCWNWWRGPLYFTAAVILAVIAISTAFNSTDEPQPAAAAAAEFSRDLIANASRSLTRSGFHITATLLHLSPHLFSLSKSQTPITIFAIKDPAIFNVSSLPQSHLQQFFQYHTLPFKSSLHELLRNPENVCLPTFLPGKDLAITKADKVSRSVEINNVSISHADLFVGGSISIHGVLAPFSGLNPGEASTRSLLCHSNHRGVLYNNATEPSSSSSSRVEIHNVSILNPDLFVGGSLSTHGVLAPFSGLDARVISIRSPIISDPSKQVVNWGQIVRMLSSNGFISFAIGLNSVLDEVVEDLRDLGEVTIFAPPELGIVGSDSAGLGRIVRLHMVPERLSYEELGVMSEKKPIRTLVGGKGLKITAGVGRKLRVEGVEITAPDALSSERFVVHGISRAFELKRGIEFTSSSV